MTFRSPIFRKLLESAFLLIATCLVVLDFYLTRYLARRQVETVEQRLGVEAQILAGELGSIPRGRIEGWSSDAGARAQRSEEHTSELQSRENLVCRLLL